jgi:hypothetical protein
MDFRALPPQRRQGSQAADRAALSRCRNDEAKRDWCAELQAAATTSRHVFIAEVWSTRCD